MKIQINSLEALERLIGGDNQLEFDIRQSVVEAFSHKHLKSLVTTDLMTKIQTALTNTLKDEILVNTGNSYSPTFTLAPSAKKFLDERIDNSVESALRKLVEAKIESLSAKKRIDALIEREVSWIAGELKHDVLERRLESMVNARLKEKLGL